jgi:hypothetical protein
MRLVDPNGAASCAACSLGASGQEGAVVALRDAAERGQEFRYREARDQPGRDDDPAKFDGERADSPEYGVDAYPASLQTSRAREASRIDAIAQAGRRGS